MKKEEIAKFAEKPTNIFERVEITFNDGKIILAHFNDNHDEKLMNANEWNFVYFSQDNSNKKITLYKGDEFKSIKIIKV